MMKEQRKQKVKRMTSLMITGLIFVCVPISSVLIMLIYSLFRNGEKPVVTSSIEGPSTVYLDSAGIPTEIFFIIVSVLFGCGLGILAYVGFKEFIHRRNNGAGS